MKTLTLILIGISFIGAFGLVYCILDRIPARKDYRMRNFAVSANIVLSAIKDLAHTEDNANFIRDMILELERAYPEFLGESMKVRIAFRARWDVKKSKLRGRKFADYNDEDVDMNFMNGLV